MDIYSVTDKAGEIVAGRENPGVGETIGLDPKADETLAALEAGEIVVYGSWRPQAGETTDRPETEAVKPAKASGGGKKASGGGKKAAEAETAPPAPTAEPGDGQGQDNGQGGDAPIVGDQGGGNA